ncbi:arylsulfatase [Olivibacter ginsenosidimutans]|uniref:Arylsulfatase n=1 Tax=Olivibacter ginsenosidimutans TaxID=1176537 RepID=A0ABP9BMB3_9SPHI
MMTIKTKISFFFFSYLITFGIVPCTWAKDIPKPGERPNIIVILADDLGYSDIGCYGGEIQTPNLDRLAKQGLQFTQFYNISRCCPSRASLLTGLYNHDAGIGDMTTPQDSSGYRGYIGRNAVTIAEVLKEAGYHTAMAGKWHVSNTLTQANREEQMKWLNHQAEHPLFSPLDQYPTQRGFEQFYGTIWGVVDYYDPFSLVEGTTPVQSVPKGYYHTDAISDKAVSYIRALSQSDQPFFLYVAQNAPHWPVQALPEDIAKYQDTYKIGWEAIREQRYQKMIQLGLIDSTKTKLSPRYPGEIDWTNNPDSAWDAHAMAVHAAMVDRMDQGIGRILKALEETGELDHTLIVFLSDNGASAESSAGYGPGFDRPGQTRDGQKISYATDKSVLPGPQTTFFSIGQNWANVANTPYRLWKSQSTEGGVHTPMLAFWPNGIQNPGTKTDQVGHVMDFMATFIELAGANYPTSYKGNKITPLQGISLVPVFEGNNSVGHEALFNEHEGSKYVRYQNWKLVQAIPDQQWHLYNLADDRTELNDLAGTYPEKVKQLSAMWNQWAKEHHVLPKPGRKNKKK